MSKYPETDASNGVTPSALPAFKEKYGQESFDEAMNAPNNPKKDSRPDASDYNVTDAYTKGNNSK